VKKIVGLVFMCAVLSSTAFAQGYNQFDMLLGYGTGVGFNMGGDVFNLKKGFFIVTVDAGINYEFYITNWLSIGTGFGIHENMSIVIKKDIPDSENEPELKDLLLTPFCLTVPINIHVTTPGVEWLYFGVGANINIPIFSLLETSDVADDIDLPDTKGSVFVSLPIDIGFDFGHNEESSLRFLFRVTPTFLELDTLITYGIFFQQNWKVFRAK
jgi:hypothetical protein